jgi:hypothetical protein
MAQHAQTWIPKTRAPHTFANGLPINIQIIILMLQINCFISFIVWRIFMEKIAKKKLQQTYAIAQIVVVYAQRGKAWVYALLIIPIISYLYLFIVHLRVTLASQLAHALTLRKTVKFGLSSIYAIQLIKMIKICAKKVVAFVKI